MTFQSMESRALTTRRLRYAVAASLLLHLLLFWPDAPRLPNQDAPALLQATLNFTRQTPAEPAVLPQPRLDAAKPVLAETALPATPLSLPEPKALDRSKPVSVPSALVPPPVNSIKPVPATAPVIAAAVSASLPPSGGASGGALLTDSNAAGEALDGLRGYRLAVASQARHFKRYPAQAMAYGWAGSADIRVEVGRDGQPRTATVARSSGHEALDRAALAMIDAGAMRARLPESLRGQAFAIVLPVVFNLDDE